MSLLGDHIEPGSDRSAEHDAVSEDGRGMPCLAADCGSRRREISHIALDLRGLAVPIASLRPMPGNARSHGRRDLDAIAASLQAYGQQKPVVIAPTFRNLQNVIVCGHGTVAAAKQLGWSHVAAVMFKGTDTEAIEYGIRDNRVAELSEWDPIALTALQADGVDLLGLWHDDAALADLLHENTPTPRFAPVELAYRLDELAVDTRCPNCGFQWHQGGKS